MNFGDLTRFRAQGTSVLFDYVRTDRGGSVKKQDNTVFLPWKHVTFLLCICLLILSDQTVKTGPLLFLVS